MDEFDSIARLFRPLTGGAPEAAGLLDDAAFLPARPGFDLVITADMIVEGVHFLQGDPPELVARKLLRMNLSDLAAKGAEPFGYLLSVAWPKAWGETARAAFARGLAEDGATYGLTLLGGDTVSTPGPLTAGVTALGYAPAGRAIRRSGAQPGDGLWVSGTIGDGWLGLEAARGGLPDLDPALREALAERYRLPQPRLEHTTWLRDHAHAAMDVSDGLIGDLDHLCTAGAVGAELELEALPLSAGARAWLEPRSDRASALLTLATGGDDYELLAAAAGAHTVPGFTRIGRILDGEGVRVTHEGLALTPTHTGWRHP